jgi:hypothetical protein
MWHEGAVREISMLPNVKGVTAIGCVLAVEVDGGDTGVGLYITRRSHALRHPVHTVQVRESS